MRRALLTAITVPSANVWTWAAQTISGPPVVGVSDGAVLPASSTGVITYSFPITCGSVSTTVSLDIVSTATGTRTAIASKSYQFNASATFSGTVTGVVIPSGYSLALDDGGNQITLTSTGTATLTNGS